MTSPTFESLRTTIARSRELNPGGAVELREGHQLYQIWRSAWDDPNSMFDDSDGYPVLRVSIPRHVVGVFVRQEYVRAYEDAFKLYQAVVERSASRTMDFTTPQDNSVLTLAQVTENLRAYDPLPVRQMVRRALIVTGHPGNGKTMSLWYYLVRRLAAHEPVVYQDHPGYIYIFHDLGVTRILTDPLQLRRIMAALPFSTWCLVDSNSQLVDPSRFLAGANRFIIQAASFDAANSKWPVKVPLIYQVYILKPPSLDEARILSWCQVDDTSQERVERFYYDFGPSGWGLFSETTDSWETDLRKAFKTIGGSPTILDSIVINLHAVTDVLPEISSKIFLILPSSRRHEPLVKIITEHVKDMFVDWAYERWNDNARAFYKKLLSNPPDSALGSFASGLFERYVHSALAAGRVFPLIQLLQYGTSKTWSLRGEHPLKLIIPASGTTYYIPGMDRPASPSDDIGIREETFHNWNLLALEDYVYYRPASKTQASFNSFVYSRSSNTILAFQITISELCEVERSGSELLKQLRAPGVNEPPAILLAGVSTKAKMLRFECLDYAEEYIAKFYHLKIENVPRPRKP